jgi:hypothetical protein
MFMTAQEKASLYAWAFAAGLQLLKELEKYYDIKRVDKKMESFLLTLRSELLPERFRRSLVDYLIEVSPDVGIPEEVKSERKWRTEEFYLNSTAILAGLFDALNKWRKEKKEGEKKEKSSEKGEARKHD